MAPKKSSKEALPKATPKSVKKASTNAPKTPKTQKTAAADKQRHNSGKTDKKTTQKAAPKVAPKVVAPVPVEAVETDNPGKFKPGNPHAFKPGQSGNPAGRPKERTVSEVLRAMMNEAHTDTATFAEAIADVLVKRCLLGDIKAIKETLDRTEGKVKQTIALQTEKEIAETAVAQLMERVGCNREKAIELLAPMIPGVSELRA